VVPTIINQMQKRAVPLRAAVVRGGIHHTYYDPLKIVLKARGALTRFT